MEYVTLGRTGLKVSRLCFGTMTYGSKSWRAWNLEEEESQPFYRKAFELGFNYFDTADMYSTGRSEEITGKAIKEYGTGRDKIILTTKVYNQMGPDMNDRGLSRKHIHHSIDNSLKRLGMDYVDVYMIHRFDPATHTDETLRAFEDVLRAGKALHLGVSSMAAWQFAQLLASQDAHLYSRFVVMQNHYNVLYREEEREMIPLCLKEGIAITPYSPLGRGFVAGLRPPGKPGDTIRSQTDKFATNDYPNPCDGDVVERITKVAKKYGVTNVQIAFAWLLHQPCVTSPVIGVSKMAQFDDAIASLSVKLDADDLNTLAEAYQPHNVLSFYEIMRVGIIGTGAIAHKHAQAYRNIGFTLTVCTNRHEAAGRAFAEQYGAEFVNTYEEVCRHPKVDFVDVCTFPDFRLPPVELCVQSRKHIHVQKPMAVDLATARKMVDLAAAGGIVLGVGSQHRFDDSSIFLIQAISQGRLGKLIQCDAYVKWHRTQQYYDRPGKGTWEVEGGGALINQAIHQVDLLRWIAGPLAAVSAEWQIAAAHTMESEDVVNAVMRYASGATGVIQAATALLPGYSERLEFHGTKGSAVVSGDQLVTWDVQDDSGDPAPVKTPGASGASDPMAISLEPFERQFRDFADAIATDRKPLVSGEEGYQALELVDAIYRSCRTSQRIVL